MSSTHNIRFAGQELVLDASGALWWPQQRMLVVSDLHLEKSTFLARHGSAVAPYDTLDTLERLEALLAQYGPKELLSLGDSFHDREAWMRLDAGLKERLQQLVAKVQHCRWIEGNHDVALAAHTLRFEANHLREGLLFTHEPDAAAMPQVIGHFHPKAQLSVQGMKLRARCFVQTASQLVMPAFGSYTGGLDVRHAAFQALTQGAPMQLYLLHGETIYAHR